ncbi:MAG: hypothetical protein NTV34_03005, partial [Proteobacteria bacterium]|nr:hypothetical protein [Pseudomonadota bacterium]
SLMAATSQSSMIWEDPKIFSWLKTLISKGQVRSCFYVNKNLKKGCSHEIRGIAGRINHFLNCLPEKSYDRPAQKFIREFMPGMMISQSTVLTNIARALSTTNAEFKPNYMRLNRRLDEVELSAT